MALECRPVDCLAYADSPNYCPHDLDPMRPAEDSFHFFPEQCLVTDFLCFTLIQALITAQRADLAGVKSERKPWRPAQWPILRKKQVEVFNR